MGEKLPQSLTNGCDDESAPRSLVFFDLAETEDGASRSRNGCAALLVRGGDRHRVVARERGRRGCNVN
jgi:hypothetical protein